MSAARRKPDAPVSSVTDVQDGTGGAIRVPGRAGVAIT
jgi:hypothetical protein